MTEDLYSYAGSLLFWFFVPPMLTQLALGCYYSMCYRNRPRPAKGSKSYERHYRMAYIFVIFAYFCYCMVDFISKFKPTYYDTIGVPRVYIDSQLKPHFKHLVMGLHPDKNPSGDPTEFMKLKQIYEVLSNDPIRFAYDCYGPDILATVNLSSTKSSGQKLLGDYFAQVIVEWIGFYIGTFVFSILASGIGNRKGIFWRVLCLTCIALMELRILMKPNYYGHVQSDSIPFGSVIFIGPFMQILFNLPTFRKLALVKRAFTYASLGFGLVLGLKKGTDSDAEIRGLADAIESLSNNAINRESNFQLHAALDPVFTNSEMKNLLQQRMGKLTAELQLFDALTPADRGRLIRNNRPK